MDLNDMVYCRKSIRSYLNKPVEEEALRKIKDFAAELTPLYPDIKVKMEIVAKEKVKSIFRWLPPQIIAIYSEEKEGSFENVGFMFQQLSLYMQGLGIGSCWLGMGKMDSKPAVEATSDGLKFVIMMAFGYPKGSIKRENVLDFKRRPLKEISDNSDARLEIARLAPSSRNSQPWYFTHENEQIHAHCAQQWLIKNKAVANMNRIDMGIILSHVYIDNLDDFKFFKTDDVTAVKGFDYIGSFTI